MSCEQWRANLDAYVDDPQAPDSQAKFAALEEHLRTCSACSAEVLGRVQLKRATRAAAARYTPSAEFRLRVEKNIQAKRRPSWFAGRMPTLAGALAALLLIVASAQLWVRHAERQQAVAELLDMHVATIASANPVDVVSTDRHTVKPWFQGKLPFTFNLPELANSPYALLGGKLVYVHDQPAAQLLFELRKHDLSVFIAQQANGTLGSNPSETHANGFSVESWSQAGLRYVIVSDTNQADVHALGELLRAAAKQ
jgi:anti-sigma factor RsiW